jgi:hypothetical protein
MDYKQLENKINKLWKKGILNDQSHIFFDDVKNVLELVKSFRKYAAEKYNIEKYSNEIIICNNPKKYPKIEKIEKKNIKYENPLTEKDIDEFDNLLYEHQMPTSEKILKYIDKIKHKPLPSNINLQTYLKYLKSSKKKKFLIVGGGPNGLFIASYLDYIYNQNYNGISTDDSIDILLIDNRIVKEGFLKPYTRNRRFAFSDFSLSIIYKFLYCTTSEYPMESINYIEYLAYIKLYKKCIPMYFTKKYETWKKICDLVHNFDFDVVFDCTGGRLNVPNFDIPKNYLDLIKNTKQNDREIIIDKDNVILKSNIPNDPLMNMFSLEYFDKTKNLLSYYGDLNTLHTCDIDTYKHFSDHLLSKKDLLKIQNIIIDKVDKGFIKYIAESKDIKYYKISYIHVNMHNRIKIAKVFTHEKHKFLYVGSGDTIFHSHFIRGAGINRLFNFIVRILYLF